MFTVTGSMSLQVNVSYLRYYQVVSTCVLSLIFPDVCFVSLLLKEVLIIRISKVLVYPKAIILWKVISTCFELFWFPMLFTFVLDFAFKQIVPLMGFYCMPNAISVIPNNKPGISDEVLTLLIWCRRDYCKVANASMLMDGIIEFFICLIN